MEKMVKTLNLRSQFDRIYSDDTSGEFINDCETSVKKICDEKKDEIDLFLKEFLE